VDRGPYRFTRNPMYLAMAVAYAGIAMLLNSVWALGMLPAVVAVVDRFVIPREERYLRAKFGETYVRYCSRVRRWI
jgi:protein-S-isoprenylcysteine O-methyltransferase Ste14